MYVGYVSGQKHILDGTTVENKGKLILTEIFTSAQKHDMVRGSNPGSGSSFSLEIL